MHYAPFRLHFHRNSLCFPILSSPSFLPRGHRSFVGGNKRIRRARFIFIKELIFIHPRVDSFLLVHLPLRFPFSPSGPQVYLDFRFRVWRVSRVIRLPTKRRSLPYAFPIRLLCSGSYDIRLLRSKIYTTAIYWISWEQNVALLDVSILMKNIYIMYILTRITLIETPSSNY